MRFQHTLIYHRITSVFFLVLLTAAEAMGPASLTKNDPATPTSTCLPAVHDFVLQSSLFRYLLIDLALGEHLGALQVGRILTYFSLK